MKSNYKYYIIVLFASFTTFSAKGQFATASIVEVGVGSISSPVAMSENTGNDIGEFNGDIFQVTVTDWIGNETNSGLFWDFNYGTSQGYVPFNFSVNNGGYLDPDVILAYDGVDVYALAVYLAFDDIGGGTYDNYFVLECFYYDPILGFITGGTTVIDMYSTSAPIPSTAEFEINIDGDAGEHRNFAITWDEVTQNYVYAKTGLVDECAHLCDHRATIYDAAAVGDYVMYHLPDIAMNENQLYVTYLKFSPVGMAYWTLLEVMNISYSGAGSACDDIPTPNPVWISNPPIGEFLNPRIACPNTSTSGYGANDQDWMVVVAETDYSSTYGILGINYYNGSGFTGISYYNDGSYPNSPWDITSVYNFKPVVSYSEDGNILVGWLFDNKGPTFSTSNEIDANYPIVLNCDVKGEPIPLCEYMNVPNWSVGSGDDCTSLSIAGRRPTPNPDNLFSFGLITGGNADVYMKPALEGSVALRLAQRAKSPITINEFLFSESGIDLNSVYKFQLFDLLSNEIFSLEGDIALIRGAYKSYEQKINTGIYLAQAYSKDMASSIKGKVLITNN